MKIVAVGHGAPTAMLREAPSDDRSPKAGEVAIEVRAAAVNPKDVKLYADEDYARMRDRRTEFPLALGLEAAGVVTAVGPGAIGPLGPIRQGDEVIAYRIEVPTRRESSCRRRPSYLSLRGSAGRKPGR